MRAGCAPPAQGAFGKTIIMNSSLAGRTDARRGCASDARCVWENKRMNRSTPIIALALWIAALGFATCARAADPPALPDLGGTRPSNTAARAADAPVLPDLGGAKTSSTAQDSLAKDAVCTKCHDENDNKAILSIYPVSYTHL